VKLRIRGNSIRLRLGRSEARRLADEGRVAEMTTFGPSQPFSYAIESVAGAGEVAASFDGGTIVVRVPRDTVRQWAAGGEVGISATQAVGDGRSLTILVEKDFECLAAPPVEPQDDAFSNPRQC
jgi:hypothetical protein